MDFVQLKLKNIESAVGGSDSSTATFTAVAHTSTNNTSFTVSAANTNRSGLTIYNNTDKEVYVGLHEMTVSATNFSVKMSVGDYFELPYAFKGVVKAFSPSTVSSGKTLVTEFVG
jgi:hypothetical protein